MCREPLFLQDIAFLTRKEPNSQDEEATNVGTMALAVELNANHKYITAETSSKAGNVKKISTREKWRETD